MEAWKRVWIDAQTYQEDLHSLINCTECHNGENVDDMERAHVGITGGADDAMSTCGTCHEAITVASVGSLHSTLRGYDTVLHERSIPENHPVLEEMQSYHCNDCHTTCGDCHVSQPDYVGSGLLRAHTFVETPPMSQTCTACHGSRVKDEYFGAHEGIPSDVHFRARMSCSDCHSGDTLHGIGREDADHRYDGSQTPSCEDCHQDQVGVGSGILEHEIHGTEILSCQTCHSTSYTNCVNCHVERTDDDVPFFTVEDHFLDFAIARNPIRNAERPYRYVPVRQVPIDQTSFDFYGENLLPNFDALPTWAYATPHNIQRVAPQAETCEACHGNDSVFLTIDKVDPRYWAANESIIVDAAPPLPESYVGMPTNTDAESDEAPTSSGDGFWGDSAPPADEAPADDEPEDFWGS